MPEPGGSTREEVRALTNGFQVSQAIHVAASLGVADLLNEGPRTVDELAATTGTNGAALDRLLRALASVGIFAEVTGRFQNTELSHYLRSDTAGSLRAWAIQIGRPYFWDTWGQLGLTLRSGTSAFRELHGIDPWHYRQQHPQENAVFNAAMTALTAGFTDSIVQAYDFSGIHLLVDVGAGEGTLLAAVLRATPRLRGVVFDQPHVVAGAGAVLRDAGVDDRCQVVGGDFFELVPRADAYVLKSIVHDWDDHAALKILQTCRAALDGKGCLLLVERVLGPANQPDPARFTDLNMLVMVGGRERDAAEFDQLCADAGFQLTRIVPTSSGFSIIEARAV